MKKSSRLLYEITLILGSPGIKIDRLASRCGVSARTVYRDLNDIAAANFPIYYDRGYRILNTAILPPLNLTREEVINVFAVLQSVSKDGAFGPVIRRIIDKIRRIKPELVQSPGMCYKPLSTDPPSVTRHFETLEKAQAEGKIVSIEYTSLNGKKSRRDVRPYGLIFLNHGWYLVGFCETRQDIRTFRMSRLGKIRVLGRKFQRPDDFSLEDYIKDSWRVFRGPLREIKVKFKGEAAVSVMTTRHHASEKIEKRRGYIIYRATACGDEDIISWIISYGDDAELLEPQELREKLKSRLRQTLDIYS